MRFRMILYALFLFLPIEIHAEVASKCGTFALEQMRGKVDFERPAAKVVQDATPFEEGDALSLSAWDFFQSKSYGIETTCRWVGEHCYVFVENTQWEDSVNAEKVESLVVAFEEHTPADPDRGIYALDTGAFGTPVERDGHDRIFIVILDIQDGGLGSYYGYVNPGEFDEDGWLAPRGNQLEIVYIDCNPLDVGGAEAGATLAHEFQHLIHYGMVSYERVWVQEGCSVYAEFLCGYKKDFGAYFLKHPGCGLAMDPFVGTLENYDKVGLFVTYLAQHYGGDAMTSTLVARSEYGIRGVDAALQALDCGTDFEGVFGDWVLANYLDGAGKYGYRGFDLPAAATELVTALPISVNGGPIEPWAANYVEFLVDGDVELTFFPPAPEDGYRLRSVRKEAGEAVVEDLPLDSGPEAFVLDRADTVALVVSRIAGDDKLEYYTIEAKKAETFVWEEAHDARPRCFVLGPNFPNPFNSLTTIPFSIPAFSTGTGLVRMAVYDVLGRRVRTLVDQRLTPGTWRAVWDGLGDDGRASGSGMYCVRLRVDGMERSSRIVLVK